MDIIDVGLYASYALIALCAIAAIVIPILQSLGDPQTLVKSGIGIGVIVVLFVISYALANPVANGATESVSKLVGAGIICTYIFFFIALVGILYTEISKLIK